MFLVQSYTVSSRDEAEHRIKLDIVENPPPMGHRRRRGMGSTETRDGKAARIGTIPRRAGPVGTRGPLAGA